MGRFIAVLEFIAAVATLFVVYVFTFGTDPDELTALMISVVGCVWLVYRLALWRWRRANSWLTSRASSDTPHPAEVQPLVERVRTSRIQFQGRSWTTVSPWDELGPGGPADSALGLPPLLSTGQSVLVSLGLAGTFIGLTWGLRHAAVLGSGGEEDMQRVMSELLGGARLAFTKSVAGVVFATLWTLRLRHVEASRDAQLDAWATALDAECPRLGTQALEVAALSVHERTALALDHLGGIIENEHRVAQDRSDLLVTTLKSVGDRVQQQAEEVTQTMQGLAESLPAAIGAQTGNEVFKLLAPNFGALVDEMKKLTEGGQQEISRAMIAQADQEVAGLKRALGDIVVTLDRLPGDYQSRMDEVAHGVGRAMESAGASVTGATAQLDGVSDSMQATLAAIGAILPDVHTAALALRGAGVEVRDGLAGVATPLLGLTPVLDAAHVAMQGTIGSLGAAEAALREHAQGTQGSASAALAQAELTRSAVERTEALAAQIDRLRGALDHVEGRLGELASAQESAGGSAVAEIGASLGSFKAALEGVQRSMQEASEGTMRSAQSVSLDAAQRVATALGQGADQFESAMRQLTAHSAALEDSLAAVKETADALGAQAINIRRGVAEVAEPLAPIAVALGLVPGSVTEATVALRSQQTALEGLGASLGRQADGLRAGEAGLADRIEQYRMLNEVLSTQMAGHLNGLLAANAQVKGAWAEVTSKSKEVTEASANQLARFAQEVERSLRLPGDLRHLDETISELNDVLDELRRAVKPDVT